MHFQDIKTVRIVRQLGWFLADYTKRGSQDESKERYLDDMCGEETRNFQRAKSSTSEPALDSPSYRRDGRDAPRSHPIDPLDRSSPARRGSVRVLATVWGFEL